MGAALGITTALVIAVLFWWLIQRKGNKRMPTRGCHFCGRVIGHKYDCPLHNYRDGD